MGKIINETKTINKIIKTINDTPTVKYLKHQYSTNDLVLNPSYQRNYIKDPKTASRFIESLLLGIPLPTIYLAENEDDTLSVIDGSHQLN